MSNMGQAGRRRVQMILPGRNSQFQTPQERMTAGGLQMPRKRAPQPVPFTAGPEVPYAAQGSQQRNGPLTITQVTAPPIDPATQAYLGTPVGHSEEGQTLTRASLGGGYDLVQSAPGSDWILLKDGLPTGGRYPQEYATREILKAKQAGTLSYAQVPAAQVETLMAQQPARRMDEKMVAGVQAAADKTTTEMESAGGEANAARARAIAELGTLQQEIPGLLTQDFRPKNNPWRGDQFDAFRQEQLDALRQDQAEAASDERHAAAMTGRADPFNSPGAAARLATMRAIAGNKARAAMDADAYGNAASYDERGEERGYGRAVQNIGLRSGMTDKIAGYGMGGLDIAGTVGNARMRNAGAIAGAQQIQAGNFRGDLGVRMGQGNLDRNFTYQQKRDDRFDFVTDRNRDDEIDRWNAELQAARARGDQQAVANITRVLGAIGGGALGFAAGGPAGILPGASAGSALFGGAGNFEGALKLTPQATSPTSTTPFSAEPPGGGADGTPKTRPAGAAGRARTKRTGFMPA